MIHLLVVFDTNFSAGTDLILQMQIAMQKGIQMLTGHKTVVP